MNPRAFLIFAAAAFVLAGAARAEDGCARLRGTADMIKAPFSATLITSGSPLGATRCGKKDCARMVRDGVAGRPSGAPLKPMAPLVVHMMWTGKKIYMHIDGLTDWIEGASPFPQNPDGSLVNPLSPVGSRPGVTCTPQPDAMLDGRPVFTYELKGGAPDVAMRGTAWISKADGRPAKLVFHVGKAMTMVMLFDYVTPVVPPANARPLPMTPIRPPANFNPDPAPLPQPAHP